MLEIKDLAGLSEPATKLIEVISQASGVLYEPTRIRRAAKAEAEAFIVKTNAEIEADGLRRRALERFVAQEVKKQGNLEGVCDRAVELVTGRPVPLGGIDRSWAEQFIREAQEVSDETLQNVWARLLAGEFQRPGSYPRRLFRVLKDLEPTEAQLIDAIASKVLYVEDHDGATIAFLNSVIRQEWHLGDEREKEIVADAPVKDITKLRDLGIVASDDFSFEFSVEGTLQPNEIHLGAFSARRISAGEEQIVPAYIQPHFLRTQGPTVTRDGRPRLNTWTRSIIFDAWRVTELGVALLALAGRAPDPTHIGLIREQLRGTKMVFVESTPRSSSTA